MTHLLALWGHKYQWTDRQGVTITQYPEALSRFAELMRRHLHIKSYKETVCYLWEKYHRIYYYCYTLEPVGTPVAFHSFLA